jgi:cytochrome c oxidase subunit 3
MHALAGIIVLSITYFKAQKGAYTPDNHLGYTLGGQFWHFLGLLWIYLLLFLAFLR